jgi:nucleotidyltransferase/DNA polymerase involved in DNA repair
MTNEHPEKSTLSPQELRLIEQLREHPELMARFESILDITQSGGVVKTADEIEGLLIEELRRLGNTTMGSWAAKVERNLGEQLKQKDRSSKVRKKKG